MNAKLFIQGGVLCLLLAGCKAKSSLPFYNNADLTPLWNADAIANVHTIPAFSFIDQDKQVVTEKTFNDKIYIANFFFTSCGSVCRKMTENLHTVQEAFKGNASVALVSHTVTPWIDSIPKLKAYAQKYDVGDQWHLVTGEKSTIYTLARLGYFVRSRASAKHHRSSCTPNGYY